MQSHGASLAGLPSDGITDDALVRSLLLTGDRNVDRQTSLFTCAVWFYPTGRHSISNSIYLGPANTDYARIGIVHAHWTFWNYTLHYARTGVGTFPIRIPMLHDSNSDSCTSTTAETPCSEISSDDTLPDLECVACGSSPALCICG